MALLQRSHALVEVEDEECTRKFVKKFTSKSVREFALLCSCKMPFSLASNFEEYNLREAR